MDDRNTTNGAVLYAEYAHQAGLWRGVDRVRRIRYAGDGPAQTADHFLGDARPTLAIALCGGMSEGCDVRQLRKLARIAVVGPWTFGRVWQPLGVTDLLLLTLQPWAMRTWFGVHPGELVNTTVAISDLHPNEGLDSRLDDAGTPIAVFNALESPISSLSIPDDGPAALTLYSRLMCGRHGWQVKENLDATGLGLRTLQRRMSKFFGVPPKAVLGAGRMLELIRMTSRGWSNRVSDLAAHLEYSDQNHMRQDVRRMNMGTLTALLEGGHKLPPGDFPSEKPVQ